MSLNGKKPNGSATNDSFYGGVYANSDADNSDFGLDMEEFLNKKSELFGYYRMKEYSVEPFQVNSVEEAIEDHYMRERDYENLVFSAANLNRPVQKCATCKLDHAPL